MKKGQALPDAQVGGPKQEAVGALRLLTDAVPLRVSLVDLVEDDPEIFEEAARPADRIRS